MGGKLKNPFFLIRAASGTCGRAKGNFASVMVLWLGILFPAPVQAQNFTNLGFENAVIVPVPGDPYGRVQAINAFPAWVCYTGSGQLTLVNYDNEFLDSAGVSILDTNAVNGFQALPQAFEGNYTALLQAGFDLGGDTVRVSAAIAQTGLFSQSANTMTFEARGSGFAVSIGGQDVPFFALEEDSDYIVFGVDVSSFGGQTLELRFTANPYPPPGPAINNVYLDGIGFSSQLPAAAPFILDPPYGQTVNAGSNISFAISATGFPTPVYQWFFNGTPLAGATNSVLPLPNVQFAESGSYSVLVTNIYGSANGSAGLTVFDPFITSSPAAQSLNAGQTARFNVAAGGTQPLNFQWLKNGAALTNAGNISGANSSTLTVSNVSLSDVGQYSAIVNNQYSSVASAAAALNVADLFIVSQPGNQSVAAGGAATLSVVAGGTVPMTYQWFDAYVPLADGANISGSHSATLTVANVRTGDADGYYVVVANSFGSVTSQVAFVDPIPPTYSVLHSFSDFGPGGLVISGTNLYGSDFRGTSGYGALFKLNADGSGFITLHDFTGYPASDGDRPVGALVLSGATLYGVTQYGGSLDGGTIFSIDTDGSNYTLLQNFTGANGDGDVPETGLVLFGATLYGTTVYGGDSGNFGTMFKINTDGSGYSAVMSFSYDTGLPGMLVVAGTNIYGATSYVADGAHTSSGALFKVNPDGSAYTVITQLYASNQPTGGFVSSGGVLYGATQLGGISNNGTLFRINSDGTGFAVLHNFAFSDGRWPNGNLLLSGSTLYGTAQYGGILDNGTLFEVNTDGSNFKVLKQFRGNIDGWFPNSSPALSGQTLYGITVKGGLSGAGALFALSLLPPAASGFAVVTLEDQPAVIAVSNLLALANDPDGGSLAVNAVNPDSTNGGFAVLGQGQITYTPPAGYVGTDAFTYTLADAEGRVAPARVLVQVLATNQISGNRLLLSPIWGSYLLSFSGVPGRTYSVQRAPTVAGPWVTLAEITVGSQGFGAWAEANPPATAAFYRTSYP